MPSERSATEPIPSAHPRARVALPERQVDFSRRTTCELTNWRDRTQGPRAWNSNYAAHRRWSIRRSHAISWFQLAKF